MIGVQVLEKIPYTEQTYPQRITSGEIALMWINGMIWKVKNPNIPLVLYTDIETLELMKQAIEKQITMLSTMQGIANRKTIKGFGS